jgi:beta-glucosidase
MKRIFNKIIFSLFASFLIACNNIPDYRNDKLPVESRVKDLLSRMTLEEKAAQLDMLAANAILEDSETLSLENVRYFIDSMNIGSIHDFYPVSAALANEVQRHAVENSRLGIPIIFIEEALHGYQGAGATCFPIPLGNASTWDTTLVRRIGQAIASETRSRGVHFILGPNLDLAREIRWGRIEETFGEDVYLTSRMAVNLIRGLQGNSLSDSNAVVAEPKHFALHGSPESGSNESPVSIGEREARSTGLYVFEKAVREAGARGIMAAYHEIDGIPSVSSRWLLTDILRNEWGFDGFTVTDLGAIRKQISTHKTASSPEEAIIKALRAGLDMQFYDFEHREFQKIIVDAVKNGKIEQKYLDRAAGDVLRVKFLLGLFDRPYTDETLSDRVFHSTDNQTLALEAAQKSLVLLQNNNNLLPLKGLKDTPSRLKLTVTGTLAASTYTGGYSPAGASAISICDGLENRFGSNVDISCVNADVTDRFSEISPLFFSQLPNSGEGNLKVEFYNNPTLEGNPVYSAPDANLNAYWHNLSPAPGVNPDQFSARWAGYLSVPSSGTYELDFRAQNYGRLYIDNKLIIDHWNEEWKDRGERRSIRLEAGRKVAFRIDFGKTGEEAGVWLKWRLTDAEKSGLFDKITSQSSQSDAVVVVIGESREEVGESRDKHDLQPNRMDMEILKAAAKSGKPVITVMITGRPLILTEVSRLSTALIQCWFAGEAMGNAVADALCGDFNPSGRLPVTFPKTTGQSPMYYSRKPSAHRRYIDGQAEPLFPFGYGISYSNFEYENLQISPEKPTVNDEITVSLNVTNKSATDGFETVQLYINDIVSSVETPEILLKGFSKTFIPAGESRKITMKLLPEDLSLVNEQMKRTVEAGNFEIMIGASSSDIRLRQTITVE